MVSKLTFSQFVDLILARIYDIEQEKGPQGFIDVIQIAQTFRQEIPRKWTWDAVKVLESRGLVQAAFAMGGACYAELTGEGRLFVEEGRGTGIIREYQSAPQQFIMVSGVKNQVIVSGRDATVTQQKTIETERKPLLDLIEEVRKTVETDGNISPEEKKEIRADLDTIRTQLEKREPNQSVLAAVLDGLTRVPSIIAKVAELVSLLNT